jgi:hypothetical protein
VTQEADTGLGRINPEDIDWAPQVVASSPSPGEEALLDGAITILFDQPMDEDSVEEAFTIEPLGDEESIEGGDAVPGSFSWPQADTLVFTPALLERAQDYRVLIGDRAASRNGQRLQEPVELMFQTTGFLEVAQTIPEAGSNNISADASVTVLFNRPVVPLVSTGQQAGLPQPIEIEPAVEGRGEWISTSIFRFTPDDGFQGGATYEVTIPAGLEDVTGGALQEPVSWTFTTLRPSVAAFVPGNGEVEVAPTTSMTVTFNMDMDRAATEAAISLEPSHPLSFSWADDRTLATRLARPRARPRWIRLPAAPSRRSPCLPSSAPRRATASRLITSSTACSSSSARPSTRRRLKDGCRSGRNPPTSTTSSAANTSASTSAWSARRNTS